LQARAAGAVAAAAIWWASSLIAEQLCMCLSRHFTLLLRLRRLSSFTYQFSSCTSAALLRHRPLGVERNKKAK
jgi:hypothetical protein